MHSLVLRSLVDKPSSVQTNNSFYWIGGRCRAGTKVLFDALQCSDQHATCKSQKGDRNDELLFETEMMISIRGSNSTWSACDRLNASLRYI